LEKAPQRKTRSAGYGAAKPRDLRKAEIDEQWLQAPVSQVGDGISPCDGNANVGTATTYYAIGWTIAPDGISLA
jgi:hypothetical protein